MGTSDLKKSNPSIFRSISIREIIGYALVVGLAVFMFYWIRSHWDEVLTAFSAKLPFVLLILPMVVINILLLGLINQQMASYLGAVLKFRQWSTLAFASTFANYVLPMKAGAALRATYLNRVCGLPLTQFASTMAAVYLLTFLVNSVVGLLASKFAFSSAGVAASLVFWTFAGIAITCAAVFLFAPKTTGPLRYGTLFSPILRIYQGWNLLRSSPRQLAQTSVVILLVTLIGALRMYVAFLAAGYSVNLPGCFLVIALASIATFVAITPAALGIREGAILLGSVALGVGPEVALLAATIDRVMAMLVVFVLGLISSYFISLEIGNAEMGKAETGNSVSVSQNE